MPFCIERNPTWFQLTQFTARQRFSLLLPPLISITRPFLFNRLGAYDTKDTLVKLSVNPETTKKKAVVPEFINNPSSLKEIFTFSLDIRSVPKKVYFAPSNHFGRN